MNDIKSLRDRVKSLHVLIVDDELMIREKTAIFMKKFFEYVDVAEDGAAALQMFKNHKDYDIVVTDIQMPNMSGWELIVALREIDENIFIATMTGSPNTDDELINLCDIYLAKPVDISHMLTLMEEIIKSKGL